MISVIPKEFFKTMEPLSKRMCRTDRHEAVFLQPIAKWTERSRFGLHPSSASPKQPIYGYVATAPCYFVL